MKKKQFDVTNLISDESDSELLTKHSFNYKKFEQAADNAIKCFLRIKPLDQSEKQSKLFFICYKKLGNSIIFVKSKT